MRSLQSTGAGGGGTGGTTSDPPAHAAQPSPEERRDVVLGRLGLVATAAVRDLLIRCALRARIDDGLLPSLAAALAVVDHGAAEAVATVQYAGAVSPHVRQMVALVQELRHNYVPAPPAPAHAPPLPSELAELHARDDVQLAALAFQAGELLHRVDGCGVCRQMRPVAFDLGGLRGILGFSERETAPPAPPSDRFVVSADDLQRSEAVAANRPALDGGGLPLGICQACRKDRAARVRSGKQRAAAWSGCRTTLTSDLGPVTDAVRHNNMHFLPVTPFLATG